MHRSVFFAADVPVYADRFWPSEDSAKPTMVLIHGGGHSGSCYLVTPNGRRGWAYNFLDAGYPVVVPDWPGIGRSGHVQPEALTGEMICECFAAMVAMIEGPVILLTHSMGGAYGWRLLEMCRDKIGMLVAIAPGPPGNIQTAGRIIRRDGHVLTVFQPGLASSPHSILDMARSTVMPRDQVEHKMIGASTQFPRSHLDSYCQGILPTPPRLLYERLNVEGAQVRVRDDTRFAGIPIAVVTGESDTDHAYEVDKSIVDWLSRLEANADFIYLPDRGIGGNGHMLMLESNSLQIAEVITNWIEQHSAAG